MYGMIHRAMKDMISELLGKEAWFALEKKLQIGPAELLTGMVYEDALTLDIVAEAAVRLNLTVDECLFEFGKYWIRYADRGSFSSIMDFTGRNLPNFINNLDHLHLAVSAAMPGTRLPSFRTLQSSNGHLEVEYRSDRVGMENFVCGLFQGLLERFCVDGQVLIVSRGEKSIIFDIRYQDRDSA
ncbi:heme NO-binding domain-containing protein [Sphingorhabdus sp.]|uniref:heme NO-binding domain-containing protein n=1 Tax=Sphingorhabdus sp. TaxID=1902408 RepID=UPI00391D3D33